MPTLMVNNLFRNRGDMAFPLSQHVIRLVSEKRFDRFNGSVLAFFSKHAACHLSLPIHNS